MSSTWIHRIHRVQMEVNRTWFMAVVLAAVFGVVINWGNQAPGYYSGWGDHFVLSPEGMQWANPDAFKGDWFMANSPQPHWFFDIITFAGSVLGQLSVFYAAYWMLGLAAFGLATAMLAQRWVPRFSWAAALTVVLVASQSPWMLLGTGTPVIAQALPAVTGASFLYLFVASVLIGRTKVAALLAVAVAILHVQLGAVAIVILMASLAASAIRKRKIEWPLAIGLLGATTFVVFGLSLRPVAANLSDFVEICNTIIPYHCAAHTWGRRQVGSSLGFLALAAITVLFLQKPRRSTWYASLGLAILGLGGGMVLDYLQIPVLGELAQGTNVYRLGALVMPFGIWGLLFPFFRPAWNRRHALLLIFWAIGALLYFANAGWYVIAVQHPLFLVVFVAIVCLVTASNRFLGGRSRILSVAAGAIAVGLLFIGTAMATEKMTVRPLNITFINSDALRAWGRAVQMVVPPGEQIVVSPRNEYAKLVTERGVIADCKDVPYGGEAWTEWKTRLQHLGGVAQCVAPGPLLYNLLSASELEAVARTYHSRFIVVNGDIPGTVVGLQNSGWRIAVEPVPGIDLVVLESTA